MSLSDCSSVSGLHEEHLFAGRFVEFLGRCLLVRALRELTVKVAASLASQYYIYVKGRALHRGEIQLEPQAIPYRSGLECLICRPRPPRYLLLDQSTCLTYHLE